MTTNNVFPGLRLREIWVGGIRMMYIMEMLLQAWDNKRHILRKRLEGGIVAIK